MRYKRFILAALLTTLVGVAAAQQNYSTWGSSHPSPTQSCGEYQWPEVQPPCPEVQIKQKHDHTPQIQYRREGWDTVVDCNHRQLVLSCMPYIPVQYFNGYYAVDTIPFDPPDTSFYMNYVPNGNNPNRWKVPVNNDDDYNSTYTNLGFNFFFFGKQRNSFCVGDNGIVTFMPQNLTGISASSNYCPYNIAQEATLPWNTTNGHTPDGSNSFNRMHEAIYGVYEDTYTGSNGSYMSGNQGIYYGIYEMETANHDICHMGIATWNQIPIYNNSSVRETFQMVCYEGSNIIEVHVKHRYGGTSTSYGQGFVGIQNADGNPQMPGAVGQTTMYVLPNAPAAFWPTGLNCFTSQLHNKSYRFTPQGTTEKQYEWFRILDTYHNDTLPNGSVVQVNDTVRLHNINDDPTAADDTNGYYFPMGGATSTCPTLTRAVVAPHCVSRYVFHLKFQDANATWYNLYDTIVIGVDTTAEVVVRAADSTSSSRRLNICQGSQARLMLQYPILQVADTTTFSVYRRSNGQVFELPVDQYLNIGELSEGFIYNTQPLTLAASLPNTGVVRNKIDSVYVQASIQFTSGCFNFDTMLVCIYPNFDTTETVGICQGESYRWSANGRTYTTSAQATEHLTSTPGCDSTVHLNLTVFDKSYTIDRIEDCRPITWIDGQTYDASTTIPTFDTTNKWNCDSTVQLEFHYLPVVAHIQSDRDFFDFDHLDAVITDVSENNDARTWILPGGTTLSGPIAYYTIPAEFEEADIWLLASATYDNHTCTDSTHVIIPMRKESFWMPNIFTPESASGNNTFGSVSTRTLTEEMYIYNRNGQLVFQCNTPDCQWDGRDQNGNPCPQGTYTYFVRYTNEFLPKVVHVLKGTVTLIR